MTLNATFDNRPLQELNRIINLRASEMRQGARDALIGTAITCLKAIRSATKVAKPRGRSKSTIEDTGLYGGFSRSQWRRCFRQGVSKYSPRVDIDAHTVWLTIGVKQQAQRHVWLVTPEHENVKPYYIVAPNAGIARAYDDNARRKRIGVYGVLAQRVLGAAMHATHAAQSEGTGGSAKCNARARAAYRIYMSNLQKQGGLDMSWPDDSRFYWTFQDDLKYALAAVKDGQAGVDLALKKAANKTMGMIRRYLNDWTGNDKGLKTPFPEIRRIQ